MYIIGISFLDCYFWVDCCLFCSKSYFPIFCLIYISSNYLVWIVICLRYLFCLSDIMYSTFFFLLSLTPCIRTRIRLHLSYFWDGYCHNLIICCLRPPSRTIRLLRGHLLASVSVRIGMVKCVFCLFFYVRMLWSSILSSLITSMISST